MFKRKSDLSKLLSPYYYTSCVIKTNYYSDLSIILFFSPSAIRRRDGEN